MEQQLANLTQQLLNHNQGLEQERAARITAEKAIQRLHEDGIRRDAAATQSRSALEAHIEVLKASSPSNNVVDTRLLGKPDKFDGTNGMWRDWKFTAKSYLCATDSSLKALLDKVEAAPDVLKNVDLATERERSQSGQLYYILVWL